MAHSISMHVILHMCVCIMLMNVSTIEADSKCFEASLYVCAILVVFVCVCTQIGGEGASSDCDTTNCMLVPLMFPWSFYASITADCHRTESWEATMEARGMVRMRDVKCIKKIYGSIYRCEQRGTTQF